MLGKLMDLLIIQLAQLHLNFILRETQLIQPFADHLTLKGFSYILKIKAALFFAGGDSLGWQKAGINPGDNAHQEKPGNHIARNTSYKGFFHVYAPFTFLFWSPQSFSQKKQRFQNIEKGLNVKENSLLGTGWIILLPSEANLNS